jgi:hypothetical protein
MIRIGLLILLIIGIFGVFKLINTQKSPALSYYRFTSVKAVHLNTNNVLLNDEYFLVLQFNQQIQKNNKRPLSLKQKSLTLECSNQVSDIKIFSTEKVNEEHPAGKDISGLFNFHYIKNTETKYGTLIKEGITVPVSEFENIVDQDKDLKQFKDLKLKFSQKPILESEHQFIVQVFFENGEVKSDTTECISFEGLKYNY